MNIFRFRDRTAILDDRSRCFLTTVAWHPFIVLSSSLFEMQHRLRFQIWRRGWQADK